MDRVLLFFSAWAAWLLVGAAVLAVLLVGVWGARRELSEIRASLLETEIGKLRSHAIQAVEEIERELRQPTGGESVATAARDPQEQPPPAAEPSSVQGPGRESPLMSLKRSGRLARFRQHRITAGGKGHYAAVLDAAGSVCLHNDPRMLGKRLESDWAIANRSVGDRSEGAGRLRRTGRNQSQPVPDWKEAGGRQTRPDVAKTRSRVLSGGEPAWGIMVPIRLGDERVGEYHTGFSLDWFAGEVARQQQGARERWNVIVPAMAGIVLLVSLVLHRVHRRRATLRQAISMAHVKQLSDLGRLVGALAHEIRNPLNAIRLNLHAIRHLHQNKIELPQDEIEQILDESNREVERLSELMKTMLGYARPDQASVEDVNLNEEMEALTHFLAPVMERDGIEFQVSLPGEPAVAHLDPDRLRQILINLVSNAREAAGKNGRVDLSLSPENGHIRITVQDSGSGVPKAERQRIFEPFYSTKDTGTGLGLALVKRFVEEAGGSVTCEDREPHGARFSILIPREHDQTAVGRQHAAAGA